MNIESNNKKRYSETLDYIDRVQKTGFRNRLALTVYEAGIKLADKFLK